MASKECFHFTKLDRMFSIRDKGLKIRLENNSKAVGDSKRKISFSETRIGAIGLYSNFYKVFYDYKNGLRQPDPNKKGEVEMYEAIMKCNTMDDYLGQGPYLVFDGTGIENEGGNTGHGGIYDGSTSKQSIDSKKLNVCLVRNNDTGHVSYDKNDYIHYLMSQLTEQDLGKMEPNIRKMFDFYYNQHQDKIETFKTGNYSEKRVDIKTFCDVTQVKEDINNSIKQNFINGQNEEER